MKDCQHFQEMILSLSGDPGQLRGVDLDGLRAHCRDCGDCRRLWELHMELVAAEELIPEPSHQDLKRMRAGVLSRVDRPGAAERGSFWRDLLGLFRIHPMAGAPIAALLLVGAVFFGRWTARPGEAVGGGSLLDELERQASLRQNVTEYLDNPLTYANVSVRPRASGRVALSFDVCRRVNMETDLQAPVAKDVLLAVIADSPTLGTRLRAMQLADGVQDDRLRDALIYTLHNDPDLAVRLEAAGALMRRGFDPAVRDALMQTLRSDPSVRMRMVALENLSDQQTDPGLIRRAIESTHLDGDAAILQRAASLQRRES